MLYSYLVSIKIKNGIENMFYFNVQYLFKIKIILYVNYKRKKDFFSHI